MKLAKKLFILSTMAMFLCILSACSSQKDIAANTDAKANTAESNDVTTEAKQIGSETKGNMISDASGTLRITGPGLFTTVGETGTTDLISGVKLPGYDVVVKRWNELYPNVKLDIETAPWDNWTASLQTSALAGDVDVLLHGASITAIAEPLSSYLEKSPELDGLITMLGMRRSRDTGMDFSQYVPYGVSVTVNPVIAVIDKQILEDYGAKVPDASWTFNDLSLLSEKTTGPDPVTGNQTYGISMIEAASANKNFIWAARGLDAPVFHFGKTLKESTADITSEKSKKVLEYLTNLYSFSNPDYLEGLDIAAVNTAENNIAIRITENPMDDYNKLVAADLLDRFMFVPLPPIESGKDAGKTSSHMGDWNMAICNTSKNKDLAWEFIKFMVTDEVVQQWLVDCNSIPNNLNALPKLKEVVQPEYYSAIETILQQQPLEFSASTNEYSDSGNFGTFTTDITSVLNEMFSDNETSDEAVEYVQKNLDNYMSTVQ